MGGRLSLLAGACALMAVAGAAPPGEALAAAHKKPLIRTTVDPRRPGRAISPHFEGFSYEYHELGFQLIARGYVGQHNTAFENLVGNLTAGGGGAPVLRIGGGSADTAWYSDGSSPRPPNITFDITPTYLDVLSTFVGTTGMPVVMDLNMAADKPALAIDEAKAALARLPAHSIQAFEVGNEPDIYGRKFGGHRNRTGRWTVARFMRDYAKFERALRGAAPSRLLAGPNTCCTPTFDAGLGRFVKRFHRRLAFATTHAYPTESCSGHRVSQHQLLRFETLGAAAYRLRPLVAAARKQRRGLRISETNSDACGYKPGGVSKTFGSALWSVDWMYLLAAIGVQGVNFHASGNMSPFITLHPQGEWEATVLPLYYGMLAFARGSGDRPRILLGATLGARVARGATASAWATVDRSRTVRVAVLEKDRTKSGMASIVIKGARARANLTYMRAPGLDATTGVTLAGQSVNKNGELVGQTRVSTVMPHHHTYRFRLPAGSAAFLTVPHVH